MTSNHINSLTVKRVAVVGAGLAGLAAIKQCLEENLEPVCYEQRSDLGGLWNYVDDIVKGRSSVFRTTVPNTCKETYCYSDFPVPDSFPVFLSQPWMIKYFRMYAKRFDLENHIQYNSEVTRIEQAEDFHSTGRWWVTVRQDKTDREQRELFDAVMVCNGHHWDAFTPIYPGHDEFKGRQLHSNEYRHPEWYKGKRVVVVGFGNSAVDIACEIGRECEQVYLSTRKGAWIFPRLTYNGIPFAMNVNRKVVSILKPLIPPVIANYGFVCVLDSQFSHEKFGIEPKHWFESQNPTCTDELPSALLSGRIKVKCGIKSLTENSVIFEDGTREENIDAIIYGTGYNLSFPFVKHSAFEVKDHQTEFYKFVFPPDITPPTIAVIGCVEAFGPILASCEIHARWAAAVFSGRVKLPSRDHMWNEIRSRNKKIYNIYQHTMRHGIHYDWIEQMNDVAEELGCKPDIKSYIWKDPRLAWALFFGPTLPSHYRLTGPGAWPNARENILRMWDRLIAPSKTRRIERGDWRTVGAMIKGVILFMIILWLFAL